MLTLRLVIIIAGSSSRERSLPNLPAICKQQIGEVDDSRCTDVVAAGSWDSGEPGTIQQAHGAVVATLLDGLPFAASQQLEGRA
jgi:hypothetical protein